MAKYVISENRVITCEGKRIGTFDEEGRITLEVDEISGQALGYLKKLVADEKVRVSVRPENGLQPHATEVPEAPPMDPRYGDKTPAYAEWMFKFFPDKAAMIYAGRKIMGRQMPMVIGPKTPPLPSAAETRTPEPGADVPESAMGKEAPEQWM